MRIVSGSTGIRALALAAVAAALMSPAAIVESRAAENPPDVVDRRAAQLDDFDRFCRFVADDYAYFDRKRTDWTAVCAADRERAGAAPDSRAFIRVVERALDELYDPHAHLGVSTQDSHRLVPTNADLHAVWRDGRATIADVRAHSAAAAGLRAGMQVVAIDGRSVADAIAALAPTHLRAPDPAADDWALDVALAGRQDDRPVHVTALDGARRREFAYVPQRPATDGPLALDCSGDVAIVAFHNSLGDTETVRAFDDALAGATCKHALVLDLRDTPSGGNTMVARGIIGRLITVEAAYQRHERPSEWRETGVRHVWIEQVEPRGAPYLVPVVVLVGHWTGSMGEGLAIGLNAARNAPVMGRPMAGLLGALDETELPFSKIVVRVPAERLSHVDGTPREAFVPCPIIGAASSPDADADAELQSAVRLARTLSRTSASIANPPIPASRRVGSCRSVARITTARKRARWLEHHAVASGS